MNIHLYMCIPTQADPLLFQKTLQTQNNLGFSGEETAVANKLTENDRTLMVVNAVAASQVHAVDHDWYRQLAKDSKIA